MKRTHLFGTMMACTLAAAVSVGAQDRPTTTSQSDRDSKSVTVTGCLKSGSSAATGTTGSTGTAGTAGTAGSTASSSARAGFIITDAVVKDSGSSTASGTAGATSPTGSTAGTSGTSASATTPGGAGKTYSLVGGSQSELQTLVNSKVEIRGTLDQNANRSAGAGSTAGGSTTGTPTTATPTTSTPTTGTGAGMSGMSHGDNQQLRVTSVTKIEGSCSGQ